MVSTQNQSLCPPQYTFESPRQQDFSLPAFFLKYITQNGAVYEKLIQTCKYFFARHQIIPMKIVRVKNLSTVNLSKLWAYDTVMGSGNSEACFSSFLKSVYRCTPTSLKVWDQKIEVNEFSKISANIKDLIIYNSTFFFPDKTQASIWDILALMPKLESFENHFNGRNSPPLSTKNTTIPILPNLKKYYFQCLDKVDFPEIAEFIKLHPNTTFSVYLEGQFSDIEAFKTMLEETFPGIFIIQTYCSNGRCFFECSLGIQDITVQFNHGYLEADW